MEVKLNALRRGDTFALAGINWKVLKELEPAHSGAVQNYFCEAAEDIFQAPFDENGNNNWNNASLRERLNGDFLDALEKERPGILEFIVPTYRDLTADDGLNDYGACLDKVTMLTADEYRETRDLHPAPEHWRWLITPDGTSASSGTSFVRYVYSDGSLYDYYAYRGLGGVRPALTLKSDISVSVDDQEDQAEEPEEMTPEQREMALYEAAVEKFGEIAQIGQATEEMAELIVALNKYKRYVNFQQGNKEEILAHIAEERADVEIMLNQLHVIFGDNSEKELEKLSHLSGLVGMEDIL